MSSFNLVIIIFSLVKFCGGWVFTDVEYDKLMKSLYVDYEDYEDYDFDLTDEDLQQLKLSPIYPGTKWCGAGNIAEDYNDLGTAVEADKCCREHDYCPDLISAGETKYNLRNDAFYTRLHCKCDEAFRKCLRNANTSTARQIGNVYFNTLGTQCFRNDYPVIGCKKRGGWLKNKCLVYNYDTEGEKSYQWFDVPNY